MKRHWDFWQFAQEALEHLLDASMVGILLNFLAYTALGRISTSQVYWAIASVFGFLIADYGLAFVHRRRRFEKVKFAAAYLQQDSMGGLSHKPQNNHE